MNNDDVILTVREAAALLKICPKTLYNWVNITGFPALKLGNTIRIHQGQLIDWVKSRAASTKEV